MPKKQSRTIICEKNIDFITKCVRIIVYKNV